MSEQRLEAYRKRRDPQKSPEPEGRRGRRGRRPRFVIQEHSARAHHFDLRLEVDGVLRSWAVPKGPSTDPREKRLAVPVEDHPLDYADFEGVIPAGQYGAGAVVVWDRGTYDNLTMRDGKPQPVEQALRDGHLVIELHGEKLKGGYALQRVATGEDERWLLIKLRDAAADARRRPTSSQPQSVLSGRTVTDLAREAERADG
ncbi:MAG TPA: DNA polymerase ligase N-terminal domain-containing protein [Kofleriaceae bacterium]|nr:DNA polymerase ligase N-terminal domain-containing protein [Kofleriaceae bacterium]